MAQENAPLASKGALWTQRLGFHDFGVSRQAAEDQWHLRQELRRLRHEEDGGSSCASPSDDSFPQRGRRAVIPGYSGRRREADTDAGIACEEVLAVEQ